MANIKDFIKKIGNETVSLEEQQRALAAVEQTIVEAKAKREESIGKNVDLVISALKKIESDLEAKLVELNNTPAKQGVAGPKGEKGRDGRDGKDGYKGQDGKDGVDGKDGKDGSDGISVTDAKVDFDGSLVITLSDGREIDAGTVVSLDVAKNIHSVQTGGTGSTSQAVLDAVAAIQATIATYGTMATQNANAVAITGGTINGTTIGATTASTGRFSDLTDTGLTSGRVVYASTGGNLVDASNFTYDGTNLVAGAIQNTPIGATTPSTVNATTITGQTGVLRGTGQNLVTQSQTFNTTWTQSTVTITANSEVAPDSSLTADTLVANATTATHFIAGTVSITSGITYSTSIFAKAGNTNFLQIFAATAQFGSNVFANFNLSTGAVGTVGSSTTASIQSVGNGWYRCTMIGIATANSTSADVIGFVPINSSTAARNPSFDGTNHSIYIWGAQVEIGSVTNTYIPTTTTAVYGTPTLSFSGVSEIGLLSNGALYLQPAGTGALQAQATTSTTAGGNARGANAVDWQTERNTAAQVASASYGMISGGYRNTVSGSYSAIGGGFNNTASAIGCGVFGGNTNSASSNRAFVVGGQSNTAGGFYNFIGGGWTNSGTSASAVTTQSGTMNATTAVTLSGSNANIKVGQYITGTSIANDTYVSAISGTSLTLSQAASGSSTSTLSFFNPHGVVVGGGNNQATGAYSAILGGGDAGSSANRNVASGDYAVVVGGANNRATALGSFVGGGGFDGGTAGNLASGIASTISGGVANTASGSGSVVAGGYNNIASGSRSSILGGYYGTTRGIVGMQSSAACLVPIGYANGISQASLLILAVETTNATATVLRSDPNAASGTNQVILPNNSAYFFTGEVVSGVTGGGDTKGWTIEGVIKRGANAAATTLVGVTVMSSYADLGAATWTIGVTADTTNGGLRVTFTGQASTTIRTVCSIRSTEMTF
jgi:hypothetical protein